MDEKLLIDNLLRKMLGDEQYSNLINAINDCYAVYNQSNVKSAEHDVDAEKRAMVQEQANLTCDLDDAHSELNKIQAQIKVHTTDVANYYGLIDAAKHKLTELLSKLKHAETQLNSLYDEETRVKTEIKRLFDKQTNLHKTWCAKFPAEHMPEAQTSEPPIDAVEPQSQTRDDKFWNELTALAYREFPGGTGNQKTWSQAHKRAYWRWYNFWRHH